MSFVSLDLRTMDTETQMLLLARDTPFHDLSKPPLCSTVETPWQELNAGICFEKPEDEESGLAKFFECMSGRAHDLSDCIKENSIFRQLFKGMLGGWQEKKEPGKLQIGLWLCLKYDDPNLQLCGTRLVHTSEEYYVIFQKSACSTDCHTCLLELIRMGLLMV